MKISKKIINGIERAKASPRHDYNKIFILGGKDDVFTSKCNVTTRSARGCWRNPGHDRNIAEAFILRHLKKDFNSFIYVIYYNDNNRSPFKYWGKNDKFLLFPSFAGDIEKLGKFLIIDAKTNKKILVEIRKEEGMIKRWGDYYWRAHVLSEEVEIL